MTPEEREKEAYKAHLQERTALALENERAQNRRKQELMKQERSELSIQSKQRHNMDMQQLKHQMQPQELRYLAEHHEEIRRIDYIYDSKIKQEDQDLEIEMKLFEEKLSQTHREFDYHLKKKYGENTLTQEEIEIIKRELLSED